VLCLIVRLALAIVRCVSIDQHGRIDVLSPLLEIDDTTTRRERSHRRKKTTDKATLQPIGIALRANKQPRRLAWEEEAWMFSEKECKPELISR
jgi:hypothetical protein